MVLRYRTKDENTAVVLIDRGLPPTKVGKKTE